MINKLDQRTKEIMLGQAANLAMQRINTLDMFDVKIYKEFTLELYEILNELHSKVFNEEEQKQQMKLDL